jgi:hypothetical protein
MKRKEVTAVFEWTNEDMLLEQIKKLKIMLLEGKEYYENVECTSTGIKALLQFKQQYQKLRSFKVIDNNEIIVKSNV